PRILKSRTLPCRQKIWATPDTGNAHDFLTILLRKMRWPIASVAVVRDNLLRRLVMFPQDFIHQKQAGEQCAEMNGSVQIINQLGTDDLLGQNQLNGGKRVAGVAIEHRKKCHVFVGWLKAFLSDCHRTSFRQPRQGCHRALQELTDLSTRFAAFVSGKTLGCVGQHKLVALFYSFTAIQYLSPHRFALDPSPGRMSMAKMLPRPPIVWDRVPSSKNRGSSSRRSSIS